MQKGRVIKVLSDRFAVDSGETVVFVKSRKKLKRETLPLPGDEVLLDSCGDEYILSKIESRRNRLIRPAIANVDQIIITLAPIPEVEFFTVDKMIVNAHKYGINTVICINKTDITTNGFADDVISQYNGVVDKIVSVCAAEGQTDSLYSVLYGKFSCFAGQSAVGKTSIINRLCGLNRQVGELSEKTMRGKNTTTGAELIKLGSETFVADTPGFAVVELDGIIPEELHLYYDEYLEYASCCKYHMCTHINEPDCAVRKAVVLGRLNKQRYERYCELTKELKKANTRRKSWRNAYENK